MVVSDCDCRLRRSWLGLANLVGCRRVSEELVERLSALWVTLRRSRMSLSLISGGGGAVEIV